MKIIINSCFGGYGLSQKAIDMYVEKSGLNLYKHENKYYFVPYEEYKKELDFENFLFNHDRENYKGHPSNRLCWSERSIPRDDKLLVEIVERLGSKEASGKYAKLSVIEIPDDVDYVIEEYDGAERIAERHRVWPSYTYDNYLPPVRR